MAAVAVAPGLIRKIKMDKDMWYAFMTTVGIIAFTAIITAALYFGNMRSQEVTNNKMTTCVQADGQWIQGNCVR